MGRSCLNSRFLYFHSNWQCHVSWFAFIWESHLGKLSNEKKRKKFLITQRGGGGDPQSKTFPFFSQRIFLLLWNNLYALKHLRKPFREAVKWKHRKKFVFLPNGGGRPPIQNISGFFFTDFFYSFKIIFALKHEKKTVKKFTNYDPDHPLLFFNCDFLL